MSSIPKLTKKQKKALAFRERKGKGKAKTLDELDNDIPVEERQDLAEAELDEEAGVLEAEAGRARSGKSGGPKDEEVPGGGSKGKKRKRDQEDMGLVAVKSDEGVGDAQGPKAKKKRKGADGAGVEVAEDSEEAKEKDDNKKGKGQRYILFVGNLKYTTTKEAVEKHFAKCDPPPTVRLMTPKPSATKPTPKSKGFAFVEFSHRNALQQGLKLHQSELDGRKINVELTAGGGGKSEARLDKVKKRNRELHEQRKKQLTKRTSSKKKQVEGGGGEDEELQLERPQRYSATSGVEQAPSKKRTWSVPEDESQLVKKRGSKKGKKRPPRPLGTGVNAIPVG